jgi:hypothetical protein
MVIRLSKIRHLLKNARHLLILSLLISTQNSGLHAAAVEEQVTQSTENDPAVFCPSQDFHTFFEIFAASEAVQRAFTRTPLKILDVDKHAIPSQVRFFSTLSADEIIFPILSSAQEKTKHLFIWEVQGVTDKHAEVTIRHFFNNKKTYDSLSYLFNKDNKDRCWKLEFIDCFQAGCGKALKFDKYTEHPKQGTLKQKETLSCPFSDFQSFLYAFAENKTVQQAFTKVPLTLRYIDHQNNFSGLIRIINVLDHQEITSVLSPLTRARKRFAFDLRLIGHSDRHAEINISGPNSGFNISYFFQKNACWELVFVDDHST